MKDTKTFTTISADILAKGFLHTHDMQKMTEYYSKTPMGDVATLGMLRSTCRAAMAGRNSPGNQRYSLKTA